MKPNKEVQKILLYRGDSYNIRRKNMSRLYWGFINHEFHRNVKTINNNIIIGKSYNRDPDY